MIDVDNKERIEITLNELQIQKRMRDSGFCNYMESMHPELYPRGCDVANVVRGDVSILAAENKVRIHPDNADGLQIYEAII